MKQTLQAKYEWKFINEKRQNWDASSSGAWKKLTSRFGPKISQEELLSLAQVVSVQLDIELTREYKRRKEILIKWFDENLDVIWPFIEKNVVVSDIRGQVIDMTKSCDNK